MIEADALKLLIETCQKAAAPVLLEQSGRQSVYSANGAQWTIERPIKDRNHIAGSLADIITLANRFVGENLYQPVVWFNESAVVVVIDDTYDADEKAPGPRIQRATLTLQWSDTMVKARALKANPSWLEQKPFERLLRVDLAGTLEPAELLIPVRKITWTHGAKTTAAVGRQAESLGREITSTATTDGRELPEVVKLQIPVFKTYGETERYCLNCAVDVDPAECKLQLLPLPDEIERVTQLAVASIGDRLEAGLAQGVPAYYGAP